ncbi:MAG TPA: hypothetical protein VD997_16845 [Phycisphaerales bacterium]|nr:hypothetical protein [Phycisphaerales bacterium]
MANTLVAVGDSLTQGFQSGAISRADWSYPAMMARALGLSVGGPEADFRVPDFSGEGGLPVNLERLFRRLGESYGTHINIGEYTAALGTIGRMLGGVEDYWERGAGAGESATGPLHHNLAVWGFELGDCDTLTEALCRRSMPPARDQLWVQNQIPEMAMYRTARRVLNPMLAFRYEELTQLGAVERLIDEQGPVGTLLLALGSNNVLGTCTSLEVRWSQSADFRKLAHQRTCNIWEVEHFKVLLERVAARITGMQRAGGIGQVIIGTVPHVTIAPVARGISPYARSEFGKAHRVPERVRGYYEYYTHFWVWDDDFCEDPHAYPHLTREDAETIDRTIDGYNTLIRETAARHGWGIVDFCRVLDGLAFRRNDGVPSYRFPEAMVGALRRNPKTAWRVFADDVDGRQRVLLDTRYINVKSAMPDEPDFRKMQEKHRGGLFSLDGIHPTTVCYGIMAHEALLTMRSLGVPGADPARLDWDAIIANDTLLMDLPKVVENLQNILGFLASRSVLARVIRSISGYGSQPD